MSVLYPYLTAVAGIVLLMALWMVAQSLWRKVFPGVADQEDVLAVRSRGCGCAHQADCDKLIPGGPDPKPEACDMFVPSPSSEIPDPR